MLQQALVPALLLEKYPKSQIDVFVNVLENDGTYASLAAAVTVASLALQDAGFEMRDSVMACSAVGF